MIFGLFKKDQTADLVFTNGNVYTQDGDLPWAEAVACKDGEIIYVGSSSEIQEFVGSDTCIIDMEGKYLLPGFINTHSHPVFRVFEGFYIEIPETMDIENITGMLSDYISDNPQEDVYFAYGFNAELLKEYSKEDASRLLDEVSEEKPIVIVSRDESDLWVNSCALELARESARQEGLPMITMPYFIQATAPFDYEELQNRVIQLAAEYCSRGFTSIFDAGAPEFMNNIYQDMIIDMHQREMLKQRYFSSLLVTGNVNPDSITKKLMQKRTLTTELEDYIHCNTLKLIVAREEFPIGIKSDSLGKAMESAAERGFNIHVDALDKTAFREVMTAIDRVRNAGFRKNIFVVACDEEVRLQDGDFSLDDLSLDNVFIHPSTNREISEEYGALEGAASVEEMIDILTLDGAIALGVNDTLGSLEKGKQADMVMFEDNPFDVVNPAIFKKLQAVMTVVAGQIVYDVEQDNMQEWYDILTAMQC